MTDEERGESLVGIPAKSSEKAPVRIASEERSTFSEALLLVNRVFRNEQASGSRNREREKLPGVELRTNGFLGKLESWQPRRAAGRLHEVKQS